MEPMPPPPSMPMPMPIAVRPPRAVAPQPSAINWSIRVVDVQQTVPGDNGPVTRPVKVLCITFTNSSGEHDVWLPADDARRFADALTTNADIAASPIDIVTPNPGLLLPPGARP